ncbi:hypothetical protein P9112_010862 [Eukaryota sp. TZLM1-RC]
MNKPVQIIDETGTYTHHLDDFCQSPSNSSLKHKYGLLSVMGAQSSGKSTLLNHLFDTQFPVLNSSAGRQQTTLGLWLARPSNLDNILVMDSEGTDGRERGDQLTFERRFALFSLVLADVVMVNLWHNDVGRHQAANLSLLRTVLEANVRLFISSNSNISRKTLIFVIRDHLEKATSLKVLESQLTDDVERLWSDVVSRTGLTDLVLTDLFDLQCFGIPHMILEKQGFDDAVSNLHDVLSGLFTRHKSPLPFSDLSLFSNQIWETISSDKDLDVPSQLEMIALFRGREILDELKCTVEEELKKGSIRECVKNGEAMTNLGNELFNFIGDLCGLFSRKVAHYHGSGKEKVTLEFIDLIEDLFLELLERNIVNYGDASLSHFKKKLESVQNQAEETVFVEALGTFLENSSQKIVKKFQVFVAKTVKLNELSNDDSKRLFNHIWNRIGSKLSQIGESVLEKLNQSIADVIDDCKRDYRSKITTFTTNQLSKSIKSINFPLPNSESLWSDFWSLIGEFIENAEKVFAETCHSMELDIDHSYLKEHLTSVAVESASVLFKTNLNPEILENLCRKLLHSGFPKLSQISFYMWIKQSNSEQNLEEVRKNIVDFLNKVQNIEEPSKETTIVLPIWNSFNEQYGSKLFTDDVIDQILTSLSSDFSMIESLLSQKDKQYRKLIVTVLIIAFVFLLFSFNKPKLLVFILLVILLFNIWGKGNLGTFFNLFRMFR